MAAEVLSARWTLLLLRELVSGSTRFNDLRRGLPRMSPALLSKRLKELETAGTVSRVPVSGEPGLDEYRRFGCPGDSPNLALAARRAGSARFRAVASLPISLW